MASWALLRTLSAARITPLTITRTYVIPARTFTPRTFAPIKTQKASASTGTEIPEFIDTLPDTSKEVNVPPQLNGQGNGNGIGNENGNGLGVDLNGHQGTDWSKSYSGLSTQAFSKDIVEVLLAPIDPLDVEIKPDGLSYLPEIKYRRVLNRAFGPGAWGLAPRSETNVGPKIVSREYALVCQGRLVAIARGEQEYFDPSGIPTATESCKSNALMRCCKDLGIASELWDPRFIREFKAKYCVEIFAEHLPTKKKKKLWRRKDQPKFEYPWKE